MSPSGAPKGLHLTATDAKLRSGHQNLGQEPFPRLKTLPQHHLILRKPEVQVLQQALQASHSPKLGSTSCEP